MDKNIIEISDLTKKYGDTVVVDRLNLSIQKGEVFGLLGPNGAGKSTTIRMLLGLTELTNGTVNVGGYSAQYQPFKVKEIVGYLPEDVGFYNHLTAYQNLMFTAKLNKIPITEANKRITHLLALVGLSNEGKKKVGIYSRGMKQRLGMADVLIKKPQVIILDEPTLGLDPKGMKELLDQIKNLSKNEGLTVLFSSHHLHQVQHICDRIGLFVKGKLIASGDMHDLSLKLFAESPLIIKAGIKTAINGSQQLEMLKDELSKIRGVTELQYRANEFVINCKKDVSDEIANVIVSSKIGLVSLNKNEYGLNDIYNKYFEGGEHGE